MVGAGNTGCGHTVGGGCVKVANDTTLRLLRWLSQATEAGSVCWYRTGSNGYRAYGSGLPAAASGSLEKCDTSWLFEWCYGAYSLYVLIPFCADEQPTPTEQAALDLVRLVCHGGSEEDEFATVVTHARCEFEQWLEGQEQER